MAATELGYQLKHLPDFVTKRQIADAFGAKQTRTVAAYFEGLRAVRIGKKSYYPKHKVIENIDKHYQ